MDVLISNYRATNANVLVYPLGHIPEMLDNIMRTPKVFPTETEDIYEKESETEFSAKSPKLEQDNQRHRAYILSVAGAQGTSDPWERR